MPVIKASQGQIADEPLEEKLGRQRERRKQKKESADVNNGNALK